MVRTRLVGWSLTQPREPARWTNAELSQGRTLYKEIASLGWSCSLAEGLGPRSLSLKKNGHVNGIACLQLQATAKRKSSGNSHGLRTIGYRDEKHGRLSYWGYVCPPVWQYDVRCCSPWICILFALLRHPRNKNLRSIFSGSPWEQVFSLEDTMERVLCEIWKT